MWLDPIHMRHAFLLAIHATPTHTWGEYRSPWAFERDLWLYDNNRSYTRREALDQSLLHATRGGYDGPRFSEVASVQQRAELLVPAYVAWGEENHVDVPSGQFSNPAAAAVRRRKSLAGTLLHRAAHVAEITAYYDTDDEGKMLHGADLPREGLERTIRALARDINARDRRIDGTLSVRAEQSLRPTLYAFRFTLDHDMKHPRPHRGTPHEEYVDEMIAAIAGLETLCDEIGLPR